MARIVRHVATAPVKLEPSDKPVFVCACGLSKRFPFCDGTHKTCREEAEGQTFVYDEHGQRHPAPKA